MKKVFYYILFLIILIIAIIDPQNSLGLRYPLLGAFIPIYVLYSFTSFSYFEKKYFIIILSYFLPAWGLILYLFRGNLSFSLTDTSYISFAIVFSFVHLLSKSDINEYFKKASLIAGLFFSLLILFNAYELIITKSNVLTNFVIENEIARVSFRDYGGLEVPYVYYYASTILILPISILIESKSSFFNFILFLLMVTSFFLSGTRSHNIMSILFLLIYIRKLLNKKTFHFLFFVLCIGVLFGFSNGVFSDYESIFGSKEDSNSFKISMLSKYINMFSDPITLLFGQGFQAVDWNNDLMSIVTDKATKTELTYLELYRVFGFFLPTFILYYFIHFLVKSINPKNTYKKIVLIALLFDSLFNPHIFSTYGAILMAVVFSKQISFTSFHKRKYSLENY